MGFQLAFLMLNRMQYTVVFPNCSFSSYVLMLLFVYCSLVDQICNVCVHSLQPQVHTFDLVSRINKTQHISNLMLHF
jgi:hypothetical protein